MSSAGKNLEAISAAIRKHNATCEYPATAVRMNPFEVERLGWDSIMGIPIEADPSMGTSQFRLVCGKPKETAEEDAQAVDAIGRELVAA